MARPQNAPQFKSGAGESRGGRLVVMVQPARPGAYMCGMDRKADTDQTAARALADGGRD